MPDKALPLNLEAMMSVQKNESDNARKYFEKALELAPKDLTALNGLAKMAFQEKNFDQAAELFQKILKDHPKHTPAVIALAEIQAIKGNIQKTEEYLKQAIESNPKALAPRLFLARLYTRFGQAQKAVTQLEDVRNEHEKNPEFLAALVEAQLDENSNGRVLETAKTLVEIAPKSPLSHYLLARAHAENRDAKSMRTSLEKSLELDPKFFRSRTVMVKLLTLEQKPVEAEKYLARLKKELPENPEVMGLEGWFAMQQRKPQEAAKAYKAAFEKFPSSGLVISLAQAQSMAGDKEASVKTLADWIERYPNDLPVRYISASLYMSLGRDDAAKTQLKGILEASPGNVPALNDLAWLLRKDNPGQALEYAEKAVSLAPSRQHLWIRSR